MILRQLLHADPVIGTSYLVACAGKQAAMVIDPMAAPDEYVQLAQELGTPICYVVDTHVHADHLSSGRELAAATGAAYVLHESANPAYAFHAARDGDRLEVGNVLAEIWHVPGHTPEHIAVLVTDRTRSQAPWLVFTGHTLMVGDMGRTELASTPEDGAHALFTSAERLRGLDDFVQVMPGAYSGSVCGRGLSGAPFSTIGFERRFNKAFSVTDRDAFIAYMLRDIPPRPLGVAENRSANLGMTGGAPAVTGSATMR